MSTKTEQLITALSELTVLEMAALKTALEEKWGVKAAAAAVAVAAPAAGGAGAAVAESTDYMITLTDVPADKKIGVIKEAKDLVDTAPKVLKESCPKAEAESIKKKIEESGAKAILKGL